VAGVDEAKEELQEIIEFLKEPQKFQKLGAASRRGAADGPSGHGQDAARARGGRRSQVPFFSIKRVGLRGDVALRPCASRRSKTLIVSIDRSMRLSRCTKREQTLIKLLVVDDEAGVLAAVRAMLQEENYDVVATPIPFWPCRNFSDASSRSSSPTSGCPVSPGLSCLATARIPSTQCYSHPDHRPPKSRHRRGCHQ